MSILIQLPRRGDEVAFFLIEFLLKILGFFNRALMIREPKHTCICFVANNRDNELGTEERQPQSGFDANAE